MIVRKLLRLRQMSLSEATATALSGSVGDLTAKIAKLKGDIGTEQRESRSLFIFALRLTAVTSSFVALHDVIAMHATGSVGGA